MTETVVHVTTLDQWKSVLDVGFEQGYSWLFTNTKYQESIFEDGGRYLFLDNCITYSNNNHHDKPYIEYADFIAQQEKTMSKKFTEEEYQNIVKVWQSRNIYIHKIEDIIDYLIDDLNIDVTHMGDQALALANPLTREWAHAKFVEKEKKYYWTNKKGNDIGIYEDNGLVFLKERHWAPLTESEIREWGYNPDMFNRRIL